MEYKQYPSHLEHFNPKSKNFIASEYDDAKVKAAVDAHNYTVDRLKSDIKM